MIANSISTAFTSNKIEESKVFYVNYFGAKVIFDCGWYVNLEFGNNSSSLQFMAPQDSNQKLSDAAGLMYNFDVEDVDSEHLRLTDMGLKLVMPLENHPWGDRGFAVLDPNGILVYIYSTREPSEEFRQYFKN